MSINRLLKLDLNDLDCYYRNDNLNIKTFPRLLFIFINFWAEKLKSETICQRTGDKPRRHASLQPDHNTAARPAVTRPSADQRGCVNIPVAGHPTAHLRRAGHTDLPLVEVTHFVADAGDALFVRSFFHGRLLVSGFARLARRRRASNSSKCV